MNKKIMNPITSLLVQLLNWGTTKNRESPGNDGDQK